MNHFRSVIRVIATLSPALCDGAGFPNVPRTPGQLLSGLNAPQQGRTAVIAWHNGVLFTVPESPSSQPNSDVIVRTWDISNPAQPVVTAQLGPTAHPVNAHGYWNSGEYLMLGTNWPPESPWAFRDMGPPGQIQRTTFFTRADTNGRGSLYQPYFFGKTYWSYESVEGDATIWRDGVRLAEWDHLGLTGVIGHPIMLGNLLIYASDQSRTGVATYDISDPAKPVLLDVLKTGGAGGYWPEVWGGDGRLLIVFPYREGGNGIRVVDATDPANLQFIADVPLPGDECMYLQCQDEYGFTGSHKVDLRTFQSVLNLRGSTTVRTNDGGTGIDTSQFALPVGNLLVTGGAGPNQGMAIWAHQAAPDTRGPSVGYHIPRAGQTGYPRTAAISALIHETLETATFVNGSTFIVRPAGSTVHLEGSLFFSFNDTLTFTPNQPLAPDTTYEVVFTNGIQDAAGNGMVPYAFTFSTGGTLSGNRPPVVDSFMAAPYPVNPGQNVTFTAAVSDPDGDTVEMRFDFGDGSPRTEWGATAATLHAYAGAGHYQAKVQVRDPSGVVVTRAFTVTVIAPPAGSLPRQHSQIAVDPASRRVWVVNPDSDTVTALDADTRAKIYEVPVGGDPRSLALDAQGRLWVACQDGDRIEVLDTASGDTLHRIPTGHGSAPFGILLSPNGQNAYVSCFGGGSVRRFSTATRAETGSLALGSGPRALALTGDGSRLLVTRFLSPLNHAEVWDVNTSSFTLTRTIVIPKFGDDANRDGTASGRGVANALAAIAISPDGTTAYVASTKVNTERGLLFAEDLDQDNTVRNILTRLDLTSSTVAGAIDLDNSDSASAIAFSPLGDRLFASLQGNNQIMVFDALSIAMSAGLGAVERRLAVGSAPQGLIADPATQRVWVSNLLGRSVSVLEMDTFLRTGGHIPAATETSTVGVERLAPAVLTGKRIFYNAGDKRMSAEGYISCATCHLDGGHDGRVWDFTGRGEGLRNTTTLQGRSGMAQGRVHWSGNFDEIQDFEHDIRTAFGGSGFLSEADFAATATPLGAPKAGRSADLDALAAYVTSLGQESIPRSPHRQADGAMTSSAIAGKAIYDSLNCAICHRTEALATNPLVNVGTLRTTSGKRLGQPLAGIDVPSLQGLWDTAPYFHDGSAATLADVFRISGGTVIPAETGTPSAGASITNTYVNLNNDDTVHGRAYANLSASGQTLTLTGVNGGSGGTGAVEIRYSTGGNFIAVNVSVNGVAAGTMAAPNTGNFPVWRQTNWRQVRLENVPLNAGAVNTLTFSVTGNWPGVGMDDVLVSTADDLAAAQPHRQVLSMSAAVQEQLRAYLMQLDGRPESSTPLHQTFAVWAAAHSVPATPRADDDRDGLTLIEEYAAGLNPGMADASNALTLTASGDLIVRYRSDAFDLLAVPWRSIDLLTWSPLSVNGAVVTADPASMDVPMQQIRFRIDPHDSPRAFNRLEFRLVTP